MSMFARPLLLITIASLVYRRGLFHPYLLQPYEILISISLLGCFFRGYIQWHSFIRPLYVGIAAFALCIAISGAYAALFLGGGVFLIRNMVVDYAIFGTCVAGFLLITFYARTKELRAHVLAAFFSVAALFPFLYIRVLRVTYSVVDGGFTGFYSSRTAFGGFLIIPFAYLVSIAVHAVSRSVRLVSITALIPLLSLILWTGSRAAYGASALCFICIGIHAFYNKHAQRRFAFAAMYVLSACFIVVVAYVTLPAQAKNIVLLRFFPQFAYLQNIPSEEVDVIARRSHVPVLMQPTDGGFMNYTVSPNSLLWEIARNGTPRFIDEDRPVIWAHAFRLMMHYPFGLGSHFYVLGKGLSVGSHNTFFQAALYGGWAALALFLAGLFVIGRILWKYGDDSAEWVAIVGACVGFLFIFFFDDRLFDAWIWILAGLAASYEFESKNVIS